MWSKTVQRGSSSSSRNLGIKYRRRFTRRRSSRMPCQQMQTGRWSSRRQKVCALKEEAIHGWRSLIEILFNWESTYTMFDVLVYPPTFLILTLTKLHDFLERARKLGEVDFSPTSEKFRPFSTKIEFSRAATVNPQVRLMVIVWRDPQATPERAKTTTVNVISTGRTVISRSISLVSSKRKNMNKICNNYDYANNIE